MWLYQDTDTWLKGFYPVLHGDTDVAFEVNTLT